MSKNVVWLVAHEGYEHLTPIAVFTDEARAVEFQDRATRLQDAIGGGDAFTVLPLDIDPTVEDTPVCCAVWVEPDGTEDPNSRFTFVGRFGNGSAVLPTDPAMRMEHGGWRGHGLTWEAAEQQARNALREETDASAR